MQRCSTVVVIRNCSGSHAGSIEWCVAGDGAKARVGVLAELAGGGQDGGEGGALLSTPSGAGAAGDLVVDDAIT
jgi:hypothetical protein